MAKIESLTTEQVAAMPSYVAEWIGHGTCTEPANRPRAEAAIRRMYAQAGLAEPRIIWFESPLSAALGVHVLKVGGASVGASVWDSVRASVRASVRDSVWDSVWGQHEAYWLAFYDFFRHECGLIEDTKPAEALTDLAKSCGWIFPYKEVCLASERHVICRLNDAGVIHAENGPAIAYPDGFEIYAWNGTRLPRKWVMERETVDPYEVLRDENVERRAAGAACIGWPRMLSALDHKVIDHDPDPDHGDLIEVRLPGLPEPGRFLKAECPRNGTIMEEVPNTVRTVLEAQAWRVGMRPEDFTYPERRT